MSLRAFGKKELIDLFIEKGVKNSHGDLSPSFNMKRVTYDPRGQVWTGELIYGAIKALNLAPAGIGGLTTGADPVAMATAFVSGLKNDPMEAFVIRRQPKEYGMKGQMEGNLKEGDSVVIVNDAAISGDSVIQSAQIAKQLGMTILAAIVLIDLSGGKAIEHIKEHVPDVHVALSAKDFF